MYDHVARLADRVARLADHVAPLADHATSDEGVFAMWCGGRKGVAKTCMPCSGEVRQCSPKHFATRSDFADLALSDFDDTPWSDFAEVALSYFICLLDILLLYAVDVHPFRYRSLS